MPAVAWAGPPVLLKLNGCSQEAMRVWGPLAIRREAGNLASHSRAASARSSTGFPSIRDSSPVCGVRRMGLIDEVRISGWRATISRAPASRTMGTFAFGRS